MSIMSLLYHKLPVVVSGYIFSAMTSFHSFVASMAKLVRRHTSNVEIIGSTPIGSIFWTFQLLIYSVGINSIEEHLFMILMTRSVT